MERKNMVGLIIENSNLKTRITKLEEKIKAFGSSDKASV